jgi:hypothetical protein
MDPDGDLETLNRDQLVAEVKLLRAGIRAHRDSTGHDLCWHHPDLWGLLPERLAPEVAVPRPGPNFCAAACGIARRWIASCLTRRGLISSTSESTGDCSTSPRLRGEVAALVGGGGAGVWSISTAGGGPAPPPATPEETGEGADRRRYYPAISSPAFA